MRLRVTDVVWDHIWVTFQLTFEGTDDEPFCEGRVSEHVPEMMLLDGVAEDGAEGDGQLATYEPDAGVSEGETTEAEAEGVIEVPSGDEVQSRDQVVPTAAEAEAGAVEFVFVDKKRLLPADATHLGGRDYRIRINITNFSGRKQFPDGTWRIMPRIDERRGPGATFDLNRASDLPDLSRVFMYDGNKTGYTVSFGFSEAEDPPVLLVRFYQLFRRAKKGKKSGPIRRAWTYPKRLRNRVMSRANKNKYLNKFYWYVRDHRPAGPPQILFASEQRPRISGNLLRIRDRMIERGLDTSFGISESFRVPATSNKKSTLRAVYELARADYVFIDDYFPMLDSLKLAKDCTIVQVWHAGSGFKAVGYSRFGNYGSPKLNNAHRRYTYAITGSKHLVPVYAEVFGIEEEAVVPTGLPRIDSFLDPERTDQVTEEFYRKYPDLKGKRLILFAPTFRGRGIRDGYYDYDQIDFDRLYECCGEDTVVLFRMHHFVSSQVPIPAEYAGRMRDFSDYPDGNDLLHVVDLMITDYSSIIYEYSLLKRPMLFFAYDKDVYSTTRGFHRDYVDTAPGKVCTSFDQLLAALRDEDFEEWRRDKFVAENFDHVDTHSADRVIDWLILGRPVGSPVEGDGLIEAQELNEPPSPHDDNEDEAKEGAV